MRTFHFLWSNKIWTLYWTELWLGTNETLSLRVVLSWLFSNTIKTKSEILLGSAQMISGHFSDCTWSINPQSAWISVVETTFCVLITDLLQTNESFYEYRNQSILEIHPTDGFMPVKLDQVGHIHAIVVNCLWQTIFAPWWIMKYHLMIATQISNRVE